MTKTMETPREMLGRGTLFAGRYEVIEALGVGGMGEVYRVEDKKVGQEVALKLIKPEIAENKRTIERFRQELKTARMISHRNVCRMFDLGEEKGTYFITMEYVAGEDLKCFLRRSKQLALGTAISITKQVCEGLAEAHRLGVVHRDLKPGNIMIDKEGNVRIMDFGIARSLEAKGVTAEGMIVGTPEYMSPEQVEGKEADPRSDIYALGIILFEMLAGRTPFEGETPFAIVTKHKTEPPPVPKKLMPQIPEALNKLILRCLEKDEEKRYQTADEIATDLSSVEQTLFKTDQVMAKKRTLTSREITVKLTPKKLLIPAAIVVILAIAIVATLILFKPQPKKIDSLAVLPLADLSIKKGEGYSVDGIHDALINELTKIPSVNVIARQSVLRYKDSTKSIPEIARELKVAAIVDGSVMQEGDKIRISVGLIDGRSNKRIWGPKPFDRNSSDIMSLYSEIAFKIALEINAQLRTQDIENLSRKLKVKTRAYELYLQTSSNEATASLPIQIRVKRTLDLLQQAVEIDPNFALGHASMAFAYIDIAKNGSMPQVEAYDKAREAAQKAVSLDESLPEAHAALGLIAFEHDWDFATAEKEYRRAMKLSPGSSARSIITYLANVGRFDEAIALTMRGIGSNPLYPTYARLVWVLYYARRYDEAIASASKWLEIEPDHWGLREIRSICYAVKKMCAEAIAESDKILSGSASAASDPDTLRTLAYNYAFCGDRKKAEELIEAIKKTGYIDQDPAGLAVIYAQLGDKDLAMAALERGFESHSARMPYWRGDPRLDSLRDDPVFKALLKKFGFDK